MVLVGRGRLAWLIGVLVAGTALGAVLLYRYVDPGTLGPLPDMYEPFWFAKKTLAHRAEAAALLACVTGLLLHGSGRDRRPSLGFAPDSAPGRRKVS